MSREYKGERRERWSFDAPTAAAPQHDKAPVTANDSPPKPRAQSQPKAEPRGPAASPWRRIHVPEEERRRAAAAGLYRYVSKAPNSSDEPARPKPLPVAARFGAPPQNPEPLTAPARQQPQDAPRPGTIRPAAVNRPHPGRSTDQPQQRRPAPPPTHNNPHLGLTVGIILGVTLVAAIGLSWISTTTSDGVAALRAEIMQRVSPAAPQAQLAEQPPHESRVSPPPGNATGIEIAPIQAAPRGPASAVQPIEVAP